MRIDGALLFLILVIMTSCTSQRISTIVGCDFNEKLNQTDYFVLPIGKVSIPGKWNKSNYNTSSKQQFFINSDSVTIAIAFGRCDNYEFNFKKEKVGIDFLQTYYNWEQQYYSKDLGLNVNLLEIDSINNVLIFNVKGVYKSDKIDNVFLFGEKNCNVSNFSILTTPILTIGQKVDFLKGLYLNKDKE